MKNAQWFATRFLMRTRRVREGFRALRDDAALAQHAAALAQLPRRRQAHLRELYLAPRPMPAPRTTAPAAAPTNAAPRDRWSGQGIGTLVVCCAVLMIVVAVARTHVN